MKIRKGLAMIGMACLMIPLVLCPMTVTAASETEYTLSEMTGHYKTQGRIYKTSNRLYLDWSASGFEFSANCSGDVYVTFQVDSVNTGETGGCFFTVIVDGVEKGRAACRLTETGVQKVKIASGLSEGIHHFELYRQSEIGSVVSVNGVSLNGTLLEAPKKNALYIEFVGDSITTAYGNLAVSSTANSGTPLYTNAMQGYAYMTAHNKLGADFSLVAVQGIGASVGWQPYTMNTAYPKLRYPKDNTTAYDFARQPDVVVLALGTNDMNRYSNFGMSLSDVKQGFATMLATVRQKNPHAKIVWIHGMMLSSSSSLIQEVVAEAGGANAGIYELRLTQNNSGGNGHPNVSGHTSFANDLSAYIRKLMMPAPTVQSAKDDTVTLQAMAGYEYSRDGKTWQSSPTFSGLTAGTYTFYQRKAETADTAAGGASMATSVTVRGATTTTTTITTTKTPTTTKTTTTTKGTATTSTTATTTVPSATGSGTAKPTGTTASTVTSAVGSTPITSTTVTTGDVTTPEDTAPTVPPADETSPTSSSVPTDATTTVSVSHPTLESMPSKDTLSEQQSNNEEGSDETTVILLVAAGAGVAVGALVVVLIVLKKRNAEK